MNMNKTLGKLIALVLLSTIFISCASLFGPPTVKYMVDGNLYHTYTLPEGGLYAQLPPTNPSRPNNEFLGWYYDDKGDTPFLETDVLVSGKKVYGVWKYYDIQFDDGHGNVEVLRQTVQTDVLLPADPTHPQFTFYGWKDQKSEKRFSEFTDYRGTKFVATWGNVVLAKRSDGKWKVTGVTNKNHTAIVIPSQHEGSNVVEIVENCFKNNDIMRSIVIPDTVEYLGKSVFEDCDRLESLTIPKKMNYIPNKFAYSCDSLKTITLPSSLYSLGSDLPYIEGRSPQPNEFNYEAYHLDCFTGCPIESITLPNYLLVIGHGVLAETNLRSITIPSKVTFIDQFALRKNNYLRSITIPATVNKIGQRFLDNCENLTEMIYASDAIIPYRAFDNNQKLSTVRITGNPTIIRAQAFRNNTSLRSIEIPQSVTTIEKQAFLGCTALQEVIFLNSDPALVKRMDGKAFSQGGGYDRDIVKKVTEKLTKLF
ncbi:MAG: leucine-rich repeat domain-containing protein [Sphaerochaeta sp.]|nr:leucine-rich repeat domain-containing protein [Sphaerochaeta sp.]